MYVVVIFNSLKVKGQNVCSLNFFLYHSCDSVVTCIPDQQ